MRAAKAAAAVSGALGGTRAWTLSCGFSPGVVACDASRRLLRASVEKRAGFELAATEIAVSREATQDLELPVRAAQGVAVLLIRRGEGLM
jgi:hypothetical protein